MAIPLLPVALIVGASLGQTDFATGLSFPAIFYAFWEPVIAWGVIAGALWYFPLKWGERDRRWGFLSRQSYGAFILHPPVIVSIALMLEPLPLPVLVKFMLLVLSGSAMSFALAWVMRKIPVVRSVV